MNPNIRTSIVFRYTKIHFMTMYDKDIEYRPIGRELIKKLNNLLD